MFICSERARRHTHREGRKSERKRERESKKERERERGREVIGVPSSSQPPAHSRMAHSLQYLSLSTYIDNYSHTRTHTNTHTQTHTHTPRYPQQDEKQCELQQCWSGGWTTSRPWKLVPLLQLLTPLVYPSPHPLHTSRPLAYPCKQVCVCVCVILLYCVLCDGETI